ncbi:hypothetical protein P154DRAFT_578907 [Amniculicola lignicola CBS 123094]|uniref:Uncharacterized protein n=1 Tax=Amniculicola lignicola CBS 123094 TaxID=1392246 RepID=A0A6A5WBG2_9PLEO|nr:hypothetical protein P154DRAFT_578907 [Amniculicola lignicola CBS 123094]
MAGEFYQDEFDLDDEIDRLSMMLSTSMEFNTADGQVMDWADTLECAPKAIGILGECLLISSHKRATSVPLSDNRLIAKSLPANLRQCAITGKSTFDVAASRMRNISSHSQLLSRDGAGIIDRIIRFACKEQTPAVATELEAQKANLKSVVGKCTADAKTLRDAFEKWNEETLILHSALNIGSDDLQQKFKAAEFNFLNTQRALDKLKNQLGFDHLNVTEIEKRLLDREADSTATSVVGTPLVAAGLLLHVLGASVGGPIILGASAAIWGRAIFAGCTQLKRDTKVRQFQEKSQEAYTLDQQVQKLSSASCTAQEANKIVADAVRQILLLQFQVQTLLNFFQAIFDKVESLDTYQTKELERHVTQQGYKTEDDIKQIMVQNALELKICFTFIGRLAKMYANISAKYLLPGMHQVQLLGLSDDSQTPAQMDWKKRELATFQKESVENVRRMTIEHQDQLNTDIIRLIKSGILSLKAVSR